MVGIIADITKVCGLAWQNAGDIIYLIGSDTVTLGASEYLAVIGNTVAGKPPQLDMELEKQVQTVCCHGIQKGWLQSAHDCAEGGLAVTLAESCIGSGMGAEIVLEAGNKRIDEVLFGEGASRIIVSVRPENINEWEAYLRESLGNNWQKLGTVDRGNLQVNVGEEKTIDLSMEAMKREWSEAISRRL
jgi:phosphoribosylformylglycinamidine synthase